MIQTNYLTLAQQIEALPKYSKSPLQTEDYLKPLVLGVVIGYEILPCFAKVILGDNKFHGLVEILGLILGGILGASFGLIYSNSKIFSYRKEIKTLCNESEDANNILKYTLSGRLVNNFDSNSDEYPYKIIYTIMNIEEPAAEELKYLEDENVQVLT